jgi:hypothetical protein
MKIETTSLTNLPLNWLYEPYSLWIAEPLKTCKPNHGFSVINAYATETAPTEKHKGKNTIILLTEIFPEFFQLV